MREVANLRRRLVRQIKAAVTPRLRPSGYRVALDRKKGILAGSRPMLMWCPGEAIPLKFADEEVVAFCEDGIISDAYGGGCVTQGYGAFGIEDLAVMLKAVTQTKGVSAQGGPDA